MSKLLLKTKVLQELVSKSVKGASSNKLLPLTSMMAIQLKDNFLTLVTTDATNYLYVKQDKVEGEDFYAVVQVEQFSKLVAKTTSENIELTLHDDNLEVKGNGKYLIELPLDEEGKPVRFPDPLSTFQSASETTMHLSTARVILNINKAAVSVDLDTPWFTGYYAGNQVISTDTFKICGLNVQLFDEPILVSPEYMDLVDVLSEEIINVKLNNDTLVFDTATCTIYGKQLAGIENFPVDAITGLLNQEFGSKCKLPKNEILQLLDRLSLFVGKYDKNSVYLTFTNEGLSVSSKKSDGAELIPYIDSQNFKDFTCCIDITMMASQIKANQSEAIELWYGEDNAIKLIDGNATQIIALAEDDRLEA